MLTTGLIAASVVVVGAGAVCVAPQARQVWAVGRLRALARQRRMVCLTYDDGPGPQLTPRVLELLASTGTRATFYLLGRRVPGAPELPGRVAAAGHEVAAHSMWHRHAWKTSPWGAYADVEEGYAALAAWVGPRGRFRPPYGKVNIGSWLALARRGAPMDWWTIDSGDTWAQLPSPQSVAGRVAAEGGGVVLLHDFDRESGTGGGSGGDRAKFVLETTEAVIERAGREGMVLGTMSDLNREPTSR